MSPQEFATNTHDLPRKVWSHVTSSVRTKLQHNHNKHNRVLKLLHFTARLKLKIPSRVTESVGEYA